MERKTTLVKLTLCLLAAAVFGTNFSLSATAASPSAPHSAETTKKKAHSAGTKPGGRIPASRTNTPAGTPHLGSATMSKSQLPVPPKAVIVPSLELSLPEYYRDVLVRLKKLWKKAPGDQDLIVAAFISESGKASHLEIVRSSGAKTTDITARALIEGTKFHPAPKDSSYHIQISFAGLLAQNRAIYLDKAGRLCPVFQPTIDHQALAEWGNIAPYRKRMLIAIAGNWQPTNNVHLVVLMTIGKSGNLIHREILDSSGDHETDKLALAALDKTKFEPLPTWYKGKEIPFKVDLKKVQGLSESGSVKESQKDAGSATQKAGEGLSTETSAPSTEDEDDDDN
jgi:TonB family protein